MRLVGRSFNRATIVAIGMLLAMTAAASAAAPGEPGSFEPRTDPKHLDVLAATQQALRKDHPDKFAGLWINESGATVVAATGGDHQVRADALGLLAKAPTFIAAQFSERELQSVHQALLAEAGGSFTIDGSRVAAVETDVVGNRVNLVLVRPSGQSTDALKARLHPAIAVSSVERPADGLCPVSNCPNPLKAGLQGYRGGSAACMMGFIFRTTGPTYYWSTAGHCNSGPAGWRSPSETWQHPAGTNRGSVAYQGWFDQSVADVALLPISSSQKSNQLCAASTCAIQAITSRQLGSGEEVIGQGMCAQKQNGYSCGTLVSTNVSLYVCKSGGVDCRLMTWQRHATFTSAPGDSGGPVWSGSKALGSISSPHPNQPGTIYSHIANIEWQANVVTQLTP